MTRAVGRIHALPKFGKTFSHLKTHFIRFLRYIGIFFTFFSLRLSLSAPPFATPRKFGFAKAPQIRAQARTPSTSSFVNSYLF